MHYISGQKWNGKQNILDCCVSSARSQMIYTDLERFCAARVLFESGTTFCPQVGHVFWRLFLDATHTNVNKIVTQWNINNVNWSDDQIFLCRARKIISKKVCEKRTTSTTPSLTSRDFLLNQGRWGLGQFHICKKQDVWVTTSPVVERKCISFVCQDLKLQTKSLVMFDEVTLH